MSIWFAMAFQAGAINAGGFLACHRFVTHTTGFATFFGAEVAKGNMHAAVGMLASPLFFLFGSMISGYFVDRRQSLDKEPQYTFLIFLITCLLYLTVVLGDLGWFGHFGDTTTENPDFALLAILCLASGIQNASITSASGAVVRTTHLTGITTDLGIGLVRVFTRGHTESVKHKETRANTMRIGLIFSFLLGSLISSVLFFKYEYNGFILPAIISTILLIIGEREKLSRKRIGFKHG